MQIIESIKGNIHDDPELASTYEQHQEAGTVDYAVIDPDDRVKSRLRVTTAAGIDLGIVPGSRELQDGDVLLHEDSRMIILQFAEEEAFVIDLPEAISTDTAIKLGHRIGNQHWDLAVEGNAVYFPMEADRAIIEDVLAEVIPTAAETRTTTVDPSTFIDTTTANHEHTDDTHNHSHNTSDHHHKHDHDHTKDHDH